MREPRPTSSRSRAAPATGTAPGVDPDQLFRIHQHLYDLVAQTIWPRHFREFRRAKAVRRFIGRHEPAFVAAGLTVEQRAQLVVWASVLVREVETDDWACVSDHAANIAETIRSCVFELPLAVRSRTAARPWWRLWDVRSYTGLL